jgi:hypothetical protein
MGLIQGGNVLNRRLGCVAALVILSFIGQIFVAAGGGASQSTSKIVANDSVDGIGSVRLNARIDAAQTRPLKATGTPDCAWSAGYRGW